MKILYHHRTMADGAEGVHIRGIQNAFLNRGYEIVDISLVSANSAEKNTKSNKKHFSIKHKFYNFITCFFPNFLFKILEIIYNTYVLWSGQRAIVNLLKEKSKPYFIYERYAYFGFALALLSRFYKIPLVLEVNTTCLDYDVRQIRFRWLARKIENYVFSKAAVIIVVSNYLKNKIFNEYNVFENRIVVTPNAIDPDEFKVYPNLASHNYALSKVTEFSDNRLIVGFVGVFVPWHGLEFLIDVFSELIHRIKIREPIGLLLVGDGPIRKKIDTKIKNKLLTDYVFITGKILHNQVKYYINLFDIAIMPDSNPFGSPIKIFEYMIMEKPIVAPGYDPITEVLIHEKTALLFKPCNKEECLEQLCSLTDNPQLRENLGRRAKEVVLNKHTWDKNIDIILTKLRMSIEA